MIEPTTPWAVDRPVNEWFSVLTTMFWFVFTKRAVRQSITEISFLNTHAISTVEHPFTWYHCNISCHLERLPKALILVNLFIIDTLFSVICWFLA